MLDARRRGADDTDDAAGGSRSEYGANSFTAGERRSHQP